MTNETPSISIIIVNYNGFIYLDDCIQSVMKSVSLPHEIIIVDNASTDQSVPHLATNYPGIILIRNSENVGFAKGNNIGAGCARGRFILLLNNDTVLCSDIAPAIDLLETDTSIGIIGAKMHDTDMNYRHSARYFPAPHRLLKLTTRIVQSGPFKTGNFHESTKEFHIIDAIEGSFLLTTKRIWDELNGLDETLFMYGEDVEFCYHAKMKGYATAYLPAIRYIHHGGFKPSREHLVIAGIRYFHKKWSSPPKYTLVCAILYTRLVLRIAFYSTLFFFNKKNYFKEKIESSASSLSKSFGSPHDISIK